MKLRTLPIVAARFELPCIIKPLLTCVKFLAARPVRDSCGAIETPENSRLITGPDAELVIGSEIV